MKAHVSRGEQSRAVLWVRRRSSRTAVAALAALTAFALWPGTSRSQIADSSVLGQLQTEARALAPLVQSAFARDFLGAVPNLPPLSSLRIIYYNKERRSFLAEGDFRKLDDSARVGYERREIGEEFYYYTRYGSPLAFVRPIDLLGQAGVSTPAGGRIVDFGFGSIGQLRLLASLGVDVTGIEVDPALEILYGGDTGAVAGGGRLNLLFGHFPSDWSIADRVPDGLDAFISKNTLKRGYIHPEREVDPRMLVHLGVDDTTFVRGVYARLKPGGFFMIYNLHPARSLPSDEKYIPWSDGRSPFDRGLLEAAGFEVLAFDVDDTEFARTMGRALGWDASMDFEKELFGTYTLARRPLEKQ